MTMPFDSKSSSLEALQSRLQGHVLVGDAAAVADVVSVVPGSAAQRLGIYHHAYRARLQETLRDSFGHTVLYLGDEWFDALSAEFIETHPSESANLRWYGGAYPDWLAQRLSDAGSALGDHPEVAEIARLDWTMRAAFDGLDAPVLALADVAALAPEDWATVVFKPHPTLALINLRCNTLSLWHALDQDLDVPPVEALPSPIDVVVWRFEERPHFRSVLPSEAAALRALMQGQSFAETCACLAELLPAHENAAAVAGGHLRRWIDEGLLAGWQD
ncbi:MAG: DNA-binding domain-containing protein [Aquabacterium sp.]|uniref:HvfC/BufC N-terminal domain-containing protein n=1 Tax=Aquabacterium sp. TaxID=1872578 RepID=UPI00271E2E16|nr:DNA-binding domain-containing protein [Aquabacterium sp.]MDO9004338.1 DNA-binding domain-containing protein [Aquabacterium sp.]